MSALILDGNLKSALAAVRSLGARGIEVVVGTKGEYGMAAYSRYASHRFVYPSPLSDGEGFVQALEVVLTHMGDKPVVYCFSDATYLALYAHRERLAPIATLVFPNPHSVETAYDKYATFELAKRLSLPVIATVCPDTEEDCKAVSELMTYPLVIKPRRSVSWARGTGTFGTAKFVFTKDELLREYRTLKAASGGESPLIQPRIVGDEYGVEMVARSGSPLGLIAHRRIRSMSPTGGAATVKETLEEGPLKEVLISNALILAKEVSWDGPLMVEFKVDRASGTPYLMEINGRFWGSLPLSLRAGVDMPHLYYQLARGEAEGGACVEAVQYARTRHFWGDARWLLRVLFAQDEMRTHAYPSRAKALVDFFLPVFSSRGDVWSASDPMPAVRECILLIQRLWK